MVRRPDDNLRSIKSHKVIFIGDPFVGKTSVITRYLYGAFGPHYQSTVGIDFVSKVVALGPERSVKLQLWDTAGQERFQSLIPSYLRDTAACVVVYDVTSKKSFDAVKRWVDVVKRERGDESNVLLFLVGNKTDLPDTREVSTEEGKKLADSYSMFFAELSAKEGNGISELFLDIAQKMPTEIPITNKQDNVEISLNSSSATVSRTAIASHNVMSIPSSTYRGSQNTAAMHVDLELVFKSNSKADVYWQMSVRESEPWGATFMRPNVSFEATQKGAIVVQLTDMRFPKNVLDFWKRYFESPTEIIFTLKSDTLRLAMEASDPNFRIDLTLSRPELVNPADDAAEA